MKTKLMITLLVILLVLPLVNAQVAEQNGITREQAFSALQGAELEVAQLDFLDLGTFLIRDQLLTAKRAFIGDNPSFLLTEIEQASNPARKAYLEDLYNIGINTPSHEVISLNYGLVLSTTTEIMQTKDQAINIFDRIQIISELEEQYNQEGINTTSEHLLIIQASRSFYDERYDEAELLLDQAQFELRDSRTEFIKFGRALKATETFLERYWILVLAAIILIILFRKELIKGYNKYDAKKRVKSMKNEMDSLKDLIKQSQMEFFNKRTITKDTFDVRTRHYKERINEIREQLPIYETIAKGKKVKLKSKKK